MNNPSPDQTPARDECRAILSTPDEDLFPLLDRTFQVRRAHFGLRVDIQTLSNIKSGLCSEDCHYCSQSAVSTAEIDAYPLMDEEHLMEGARRVAADAAHSNSSRYCMALSGRTATDAEIDRLAAVIRRIGNEFDLATCCSLGFITDAQARVLKDAGLDRVNHNLNSSERYYPRICTTHTWRERMENLKRCRSAGLEVCSGALFGQGETDEDIIDVMFALREVEAASIPINFLVPIPGTPFGNYDTRLTPRRCLKILCLARLMHPDKDIRAAGGREYHLRAMQPLALYAANSIFVDGYLTTGGQSLDDAKAMIRDAGFECGKLD